MTYAAGRLMHDADSHLMELPGCLDPYFTPSLLSKFHALPSYQQKLHKMDWADKARAKQAETDFRTGFDEAIMLRKNYEAHGAFLREDRPAALDAMGFATQLVFTTFCLGNFGLDRSGDMQLCYAAADAHNRMMMDFCAIDRRLLPVAYIPLEDFARAETSTKLAIELGAKALMVPSLCPQRHSPSHIGLFPVWEQAQDAGIPVVFHVGGEEKLNPIYKENGLPPVKDFHGGDDNFTSVSYMPIPNAAMQTMATLIFDGIWDRFERLKWGAIELGASWAPGWMRAMDSAAGAFTRNEDRLQKLSAKPSEIVERQLRIAPYPHEDVGWVIENTSERVIMFNSDFPHIEGGRHPLKRFDASIEHLSREAKNAFYADNFLDMMGKSLDADLRRPAHLHAAA